MNNRGLRAALLTLVAGSTLASCPRPDVDTKPGLGRQHNDDVDVDMKRYYLDFDKYELNGRDEIPSPPSDHHYLSVTREDGGDTIRLEVYAGRPRPFLVTYERSNDAFVKIDVAHYPDEPEYKYAKRICYVHEGVEHCYRYLYERDPRQHNDAPLLYDYRRASPDETKTWLFDLDGSASSVREEVSYVAETPLPPELEARATAIMTTRYVENERRLLAEHVYQPVAMGKPEGDPSVRHEMFNVETFSRFYLDFIEASMFIMERNPAHELDVSADTPR